MSKRIDRARLDELIDEATVDCYGEEEEHTALLTMIEERVICPFRAKVIGETIEVTQFEWPSSGYGMLAVCHWKVVSDAGGGALNDAAQLLYMEMKWSDADKRGDAAWVERNFAENYYGVDSRTGKLNTQADDVADIKNRKE